MQELWANVAVIFMSHVSDVFVNGYIHYGTLPEAECVLIATWVKSSLWKLCSPRLLPGSPIDRGSGSPFPRVLYRMSLGKPECRWLGHHHSIAGGTARDVEPLEDQYRRKGTSDQHRQNQGPDIWAGPQCFSNVWQRERWCVSQGRGHKLRFLWGLFQLHPQKCCGIPGSLKPDPSNMCKQCAGQAIPVDGRPMTEATLSR